MDKEKSLKKYLSITRGYFVFLFFLIFGVVFMSASGFLGIVGAAGTGLFFMLIIQLPHSSRIKKTIKKYKDAGQWETVLADFENATPLWSGKVRVGQKFIFAKNSSVFYAYDEIKWIYRAIQRYRLFFIPVSSNAMIGAADGKIRIFCGLKKNEKAGAAQMSELVNIVHEKNPSAILGYDEQRRKAYLSMVKSK